MYRVTIQEQDNRGPGKKVDVIMKTETLHQLLGRFLMKYGEPEAWQSHGGTDEWEFKKFINKGYIGVNVLYSKVHGAVKNAAPVIAPPPLPVVAAPSLVLTEPLDERLQELVTKNLLSKS